MQPQLQQDINTIRDWLQAGAINLFGLPFAGKDTQGNFLAKLLDTTLIGGGDILRNSVIPERAQAALDRGELIPTEDYLQIVLPYLSQPELVGKPLVLSAVGRWSGEEAGVVQAMNAADHPIKAVIYLDLNERVLWQRFEAIQKGERQDRGQRYDDAADIIEKRLEEFRVKTLPVVDFYRSLGLVIDIDSDRPIETVQADIISQLAKLAS